MFILRLLFLAVIMTRPNYDTTFILVNLQELYRGSMVLKVCLLVQSCSHISFPLDCSVGGIVHNIQYCMQYRIHVPPNSKYCKVLEIHRPVLQASTILIAGLLSECAVAQPVPAQLHAGRHDQSHTFSKSIDDFLV